MITSETSSGFTPARVRTSLITTEHRTCTGTEDREPLRDPVWGENMEYYLKNMLIFSQFVIICIIVDFTERNDLNNYIYI